MAHQKLLLNFNGTNNSTTFTEDAQGLSPTANAGCKLTTSIKKFGSASLTNDKSTPMNLQYTLPVGLGSDFTVHGHFYIGSYTDLWTHGGFDLCQMWDPTDNWGFYFYLGGGATAPTLPPINYGATDKNGTDFGRGYGTNPVTAGVWHHFAVVVCNREIIFFIDGKTIATANAIVDNPLAGANVLWLTTNETQLDTACWDSVEILDYAKWTTNFIPPEVEPSYDPAYGPAKNVTFAPLAIQGELGGMSNTISATVSFPILNVSANIESFSASLNATIPDIRISAQGGAQAQVAIPAITISAEAICSPITDLSASIPAITLSASALQDYVASLSKSIAPIIFSANAHLDPTASLDKKIPAVNIIASAIAGNAGSLAGEISPVKLQAASYWLLPGSLDTAIPPVHVVARATTKGDFEVLSLNTKVMALTKYLNYEFNSMCMFNGKPVGVKADGVYELTGDEDDGETIYWKVDFGKLDFKANKIQHVFLSGKFMENVILTVTMNDGTSYDYIGEPTTAYEEGMKIRVGKGITKRGYYDRYLNVELTNEVKSSLALDSMVIFSLDPGIKR